MVRTVVSSEEGMEAQVEYTEDSGAVPLPVFLSEHDTTQPTLLIEEDSLKFLSVASLLDLTSLVDRSQGPLQTHSQGQASEDSVLTHVVSDD